MKRPVPPSLYHGDATGHGALIENVGHEEELRRVCLVHDVPLLYSQLYVHTYIIYIYTYRVYTTSPRFSVSYPWERREGRNSQLRQSHGAFSECPQLSRPEGGLTSTILFSWRSLSLRASPFECIHLAIPTSSFSFTSFVFYPATTCARPFRISTNIISSLLQN